MGIAGGVVGSGNSLNLASKKSASIRCDVCYRLFRGKIAFGIAREVGKGELENIGSSTVFVLEGVKSLGGYVSGKTGHGVIVAHEEEITKGESGE